MYRWTDEVLKPPADLAFAGDGNFLCGEWCSFCKAKNECRTKAEANLKLAKHDFIPSLQHPDWMLLHRSPVLGSGRHPDSDQRLQVEKREEKKAAQDDEYYIKRIESLK